MRMRYYDIELSKPTLGEWRGIVFLEVCQGHMGEVCGKKIFIGRTSFQKCIGWRVCDGGKINFSMDPWLGEGMWRF